MLLPVVVIWRLPRHLVRSRELIEQWAAQHDLEAVSIELQPRWASPFWPTSGKLQSVYRVAFRDKYGATCRAWVRCGSRFVGLLSDRIDVRWEGDS